MCDSVCRDFMRNVCTRKSKCRFKHPIQNGANNANNFNPEEEKLKFCKAICHDFQNNGCNRENCKYVHCQQEDQARFMETGIIPAYVLEDAINKASIPCLPREAPVCKDYLSGECRRGKACRFRHLSHSKYRKELDTLFGVVGAPKEPSPQPEAKRFKTACAHLSTMPPPEHTANHGFSQNNYNKESCFVHGGSYPMHLSCQQLHAPPFPSESCCDRCQDTPVLPNYQEENVSLRRQVQELRRQVSDLMTANEFLLEQNASLRMMRKNGGVVALQQPSSATLNVQQAPTQQLVASTCPVSIAPVSCPAPGQMALSTMAMAGQGVPVSCHAPQQLMAAVSTVTMAGPLAAAVPVSASQLVPVSLATVSMAPVHIPPIATVASEPVSHSMAMSVAAGTSLVSYPIMTQPLLQTR